MSATQSGNSNEQAPVSTQKRAHLWSQRAEYETPIHPTYSSEPLPTVHEGYDDEDDGCEFQHNNPAAPSPAYNTAPPTPGAAYEDYSQREFHGDDRIYKFHRSTHRCWYFIRCNLYLEHPDGGYFYHCKHFRCLHCSKLAAWPVAVADIIEYKLGCFAHDT